MTLDESAMDGGFLDVRLLDSTTSLDSVSDTSVSLSESSKFGAGDLLEARFIGRDRPTSVRRILSSSSLR